MYRVGDKVVFCPPLKHHWMKQQRGDEGVVNKKDYGVFHFDDGDADYICVLWKQKEEQSYLRKEIKPLSQCENCPHRLERLIKGCPDEI